MLKELDDYNWAEVFGEGSGGNCRPIIPNYPPGYRAKRLVAWLEAAEAALAKARGE